MQINLSDEHSQLGLHAYRVNLGMGIGMASALDPFGEIKSNVFNAAYQYQKDIAQHVNFGAP